VADDDAHGLRAGLSRRWRAAVDRVSWTPPTSTEIGVVAKAGLAAGVSWWLAVLVTDVPDPLLAPLTALVTVQVSVRASVLNAFQRSFAVVLGVFAALAIGDTFGLTGLTVGLLTGLSLGVARLVLRMQPQAASQVPISVLLVMGALATRKEGYAWERALDTVLGAAVGVAVSLAFPASRLTDARQTIGRLGDTLGSILETMAAGLHEPWSTEQTSDWRRRARTARDRLVAEAQEAVGNGREAARWNLRDRRHVDELGRYEQVLPRLERTAIGISVMARGLDDHAHLVDVPDAEGTEHRPMANMGVLLGALGAAVRVVAANVLGQSDEAEVARALEEVRIRRVPVARAAFRRAREALADAAGEPAYEADLDDRAHGHGHPEGEWLSYTALLVQVDRIVGDLSAPLPA
jgi:uncharacterized membrane protein YgaE (UPF0421/DUF939 family)